MAASSTKMRPRLTNVAQPPEPAKALNTAIHGMVIILKSCAHSWTGYMATEILGRQARELALEDVFEAFLFPINSLLNTVAYSCILVDGREYACVVSNNPDLCARFCISQQ